LLRAFFTLTATNDQDGSQFQPSMAMKNFFWFNFRRVRIATSILLAGLWVGAAARGDVVFAWNEFLLQLAANAVQPVAPHVEARAFAMTHLAIDEAVGATSGISSNEDGRIACQRAAAVAAAQAVLEQLLPSARPAISAMAERHFSAIPSGSETTRAIEMGRTVAARILSWRQHDRWMEIVVLNPPVGPLPDASEMAAQALARGEAVKPSPWLQLAPFALKTARQFDVRELRTINRGGFVVTDPGIRSSRLFKGVDETAAIESRERFWEAQRPLLVWNRIARQLSAARGVDLAQQAKLLAVLNVALADATVSTLHWRHTLGSWRMVVTDRLEPTSETTATTLNVVTASNGFESERMRVETHRILIPPTADYPSLAATSAGAAQAVLERFFNTDRIEFTLPESIPAAASSNAAARMPRTFSSVSAAARENAFVASLDGRHSRESCIAGFSLGTSIGGYISSRSIERRSKR
jgi:hypothetical protein